MMTIEQIKARLQMWYDAEAAAASGKAYSIDGVSLTHQDLDRIMQQIAYWERRLSCAEGRGSGDFRTQTAFPVDNNAWPWRFRRF